MLLNELKPFLEEKYQKYNRPEFIEADPVSIPHTFSRKEDIEIAGFLTATIAWGRRKSIISNAQKLMEYMNFSPYDFIINAQEKDFATLEKFTHRTFQGTDAIAMTKGLAVLYKHHGGLEKAFQFNADAENSYQAIENFRTLMIHMKGFPNRTHKHISSPAKGSSAKRLNMFLRWMVRKDKQGVDFGLWNSTKPSQLVCPLDVHTGNIARKLGILKRKQNNWKAAIELTNTLRLLDPKDPVKYDFSLFGLGVNEHF